MYIPKQEQRRLVIKFGIQISSCPVCFTQHRYCAPTMAQQTKLENPSSQTKCKPALSLLELVVKRGGQTDHGHIINA